jgi:hypothetical protein
VASTAENYQIREVARIVSEVVPDCAVEFAPGASPDARDYRVSGDLFAATLGFKTLWTVRSGAEQLLDAYRSVGLSLADFEGPRYQRIAHIRALLAGGRLDRSLRFAGEPLPAA